MDRDAPLARLVLTPAGAGLSRTFPVLPRHLLGQHTQEVSRSSKDAIDQNGVAFHFVADQQTGFDVMEYYTRGPFYS